MAGPPTERKSLRRELPEGIDAIELRADLFERPAEALEVLPKLLEHLPVVFTARLADQGGKYRGSERERLELYRAALRRGATLVDAELGSDAASTLASSGEPLIVSHHDFQGMPGAAERERLSREMEAYRPRAVKLVPTAKVLEDAACMLEWVGARESARPPRIGFAMGERGIPSRVLSISRGAPFTYGALDTSIAPGQLAVGELCALYRVKSLGRGCRVLGVIGNPVAHSLSPHMHNPALRARGLDTVYLPLLLDSLDELEPCWEALGIDGLSVTIPFKEDAFRRADEVDSRGAACRAVNTLVVSERGEASGAVHLRGYNTDFDGVLEPLRKRLGDLRGATIAVLGNGGAARGAVQALLEAAALPALYYRNPQRGDPVAKELGIAGAHLDELRAGAQRVIINATSLGLRPDDPSPVPDAVFTPDTVAFDMVYDPPQTAFLEAARRSGAEAIYGREMLVAQGVVQFRLFTGEEASAREFEQSFLEAQGARGGG